MDKKNSLLMSPHLHSGLAVDLHHSRENEKPAIRRLMPAFEDMMLK
jgi:hypothetical protein